LPLIEIGQRRKGVRREVWFSRALAKEFSQQKSMSNKSGGLRVLYDEENGVQIEREIRKLLTNERGQFGPIHRHVRRE